MRHIRFALVEWRTFAAGLLVFCLVSANVMTIAAASDPVVMPIPVSAGKPALQSGTTVTEYPIPTPNSGSSNIAIGLDGNFYFTETNGNKIGQVTLDGVFQEFPLPKANSQPFGIATGPDGNLWFTEQGTNKIGQMAPDGSVSVFPIPTDNSQATGITSGSDGALWFTETTGNKIGRITTSGNITEFQIPTPNSGALFITPGLDSNLWFTERSASKIARITPAGIITEFATPTPNSGPEGITAALDGNIWFTEKPVDKIGRATTSGSISEIPLFAGSDPARIAPATDGSVFVTEHTPGKILKITPTAAQLAITPADFFGSFLEFFLSGGSGPVGLAVVEDKSTSSGSAVAVEEQGNKVAVATGPLVGEIGFTKTVLSDTVVQGNSMTFTFTVENKSAFPINILMSDLLSGGKSGGPLGFSSQPGWKLLGATPPIVHTDKLMLAPGGKIELPLVLETLKPGQFGNIGRLQIIELGPDADIWTDPNRFTIQPRPVPNITSASVEGKQLTVVCDFFLNSGSSIPGQTESLRPQASGPVILINGEDQKTRIDDQNPTTTLIGPKGGKRIKPGQTATLQVRFPDGTLTPEFTFARPAS